MTPDEYAAFLVSYEKALADSAAVVLSGSLPRGLPAGAYAELVAAAAAAGVPAVLDTHGDALARSAPRPGRPIVKPNLAELEALTGRALAADDGPDLAAVSAAAAQLRSAGPDAVVVSLGPAGLLGGDRDGRLAGRAARRGVQQPDRGRRRGHRGAGARAGPGAALARAAAARGSPGHRGGRGAGGGRVQRRRLPPGCWPQVTVSRAEYSA